MVANIDFSEAYHIVMGESAAASLKIALTLSNEQVLINEVPLSWGPAEVRKDSESWMLQRSEYFKRVFAYLPHALEVDNADNLLLERLSDLDSSRSVFIWVAVGLWEQLLLAWIVNLFEYFELDLSKLSVVQFKYIRSPIPRVLVMGELSPANIKEHLPKPRSLSEGELYELRLAWQVYTSSDPSELLEYVDRKIVAMPELHEAMKELIFRYPEIHSGLTAWDKRLLIQVREAGPRAAQVVGNTMGWAMEETKDTCGDGELYRRLIAMGNIVLSSPLITATGDTKEMRKCSVELTSFGEKVLAGKENHVRENGIDEWIGGVHLNGKTDITYRDGEKLLFPN